jgi:hypothetical protein
VFRAGEVEEGLRYRLDCLTHSPRPAGLGGSVVELQLVKIGEDVVGGQRKPVDGYDSIPVALLRSAVERPSVRSRSEQGGFFSNKLSLVMNLALLL